MKQSIQTLFIALCAILTFSTTNAQTISQLAATGGQMKAYTQAKYTQPDSSTIRIRKVWSFNASFVPAFPSQWDTVSTLVADTTTVSDSISFTNSGNFFVRWDLEVIDTLHTNVLMHSNKIIVNVRPITIVPRIRLTAKVATTDGGVQSYWYHAGFDSAQVKVFVSPGDTMLSNPIQVDQFLKLDSGNTNYTFTGWPSSYYFSYKFEIVNSKGDSTTIKGWILTDASGSAWVGQVDSFSADTNKTAVRVPVVSNGNNVTVRTYNYLHNSPTPIDSFTNVVTGQQGITELSMLFINEQPNTLYDYASCIIAGGSGCASVVTIGTLTAPVNLSITDDSVNGNASTQIVAVYGRGIVPSGQTLYCYAEASATPNFAVVLLSSPQTTYTQGVANIVQYVSGVPLNAHYYYRLKGYTAPAGQTATGATIPFTLTLPADTTKPLIVTYDTLYVTTTTAEVGFSGSDNVGVTGYKVHLDGAVVANLPASATGYIYTGLHADSTYTLAIEDKDAALNWSVLHTIVIHTPAIASAIQQANLTSMTSKVCFLDTASGGGWILVDIYGTNFVHGATYTATYASGGNPDVDTVHFISSTHVQVWIWSAWDDQVTYTITNPGATTSNSLVTVVADCVTGIASVTGSNRTDRNLLKAYPNPFTGIVTIEAGQKASCSISDLMGRVVYTGNISVGSNTLDLQNLNLTKGMYIVHSDAGSAVKLVKE